MNVDVVLAGNLQDNEMNEKSEDKSEQKSVLQSDNTGTRAAAGGARWRQ